MKDNCYCCGSSNLQELPKFKQFNHMVCNQCGYENFFSLDFEISSEMYEDDPDYDNELAFAGNYKNLLQWNHHTATRFLLKNKSLKVKSEEKLYCQKKNFLMAEIIH